ASSRAAAATCSAASRVRTGFVGSVGSAPQAIVAAASIDPIITVSVRMVPPCRGGVSASMPCATNGLGEGRVRHGHRGSGAARSLTLPPAGCRRTLSPSGTCLCARRGQSQRTIRSTMSILINKDTTVIIQGITGREAVNLTREGLDYGTKIVGGVTPGRAGRDVYGVPVYDCVRDITAKQQVDGSIVTVTPRFTRDAVFEAIEAGVKLIVIVTERIPRGEVAQMVELARLRGASIIGPNFLGILSPDEAKMGGLGGPAVNVRRAFKKGPIGVMSRSGGMTTEICNTLSAAGLGQSTAVSIGGDAIIGSTYAELMPLFEADTETQAIVIYSEPGGRME